MSLSSPAANARRHSRRKLGDAANATHHLPTKIAVIPYPCYLLYMGGRMDAHCPSILIHHPKINKTMIQSFEGTTLALQHYYDIVGISRRLPLLTVYKANEQPFGHSMAVWMASYGDDFDIDEDIKNRLDEALLKNRKVEDFHVLRVLDYGTTEGRSFVVTDAIDAITLKAWVLAHGPIQPWQALRLLDQLTSIVNAAHQSGFNHLCIDSNNIFLTDTGRFSIVMGPMGIGLNRAEILELKNVPIVPDLVRHIPPWSYGNLPKRDRSEDKLKIKPSANTHSPSAELSTNSLSLDPANPEDQDSPQAPQAPKAHQAPENPSESNEPPAADEKINAAATDNRIDAQFKLDDSIQELDLGSGALMAGRTVPPAPDGFDEDVYDVIAVIYEALCGIHPYFGDEGDVCTAALDLLQSSPLELTRRVEIDEGLSNLVMDMLKSPKADALNAFVQHFAAHCDEKSREAAKNAEKPWFIAPSQKSPARRKHHASSLKFHHMRIITAGIAAMLIVISIAITWKIAQYADPVDLFAIPEILPAAPGGIDVVIAPRTIPPNTSIYLTSMADGSLIRLGTLPFIYRQQDQGAKLSFVIADESGHSLQVPVTVKGENGLMLVAVDLPW